MAMISGIGWVTAAGMGCGRDHQRFEMLPRRLDPIDRRRVFEKPYKNFGRMDEYSRLGLAAIAFALRDAGLEEWREKRDIGIIASTEYGCLWTDIDYFDTVLPMGGTQASPNLFAYTLPNCFLGEAAIRYGLTGESFIVYQPSGNGLISLELALDTIETGDYFRMLCGVCDLGRPPQFSNSVEIPPGALFMVLEQSGRTARTRYGSVGRNEAGRIVYHQKPVTRLFELVDACLAHRSQGSG
jgi:3-oxoacyl-[acyl-carrier-protein] synthase II